MDDEMLNDEIKSFLSCGIYRFDLDGSKVAFLDPVRILNRSYSRFRISPSAYYSRSFEASSPAVKIDADEVSPMPKKRKRKRQPRDLNAREKDAEKRHQEARPLLLNAHKVFREAEELLALLPKVVKCDVSSRTIKAAEQNFIELGSLWQAPLYEISLCLRKELLDDAEGCGFGEHEESVSCQLFNNLICNEGNEDVEAEVQNNRYILPHRSCFYMSDLRQIRSLVPAFSNEGFNLIVIDPPWENGSAYQKAMYPTLPSRQFMYIPVKELAHKEGALVALWVTNREKLRTFVERDLFPAWGVRSDGSLISELDLFHHRPYECLLLGYTNFSQSDDTKNMPFNYLRSSQVIISIPGDYSRKPPLGQLLMDNIPGPKPARCIELFARELVAGWTSWGNDPLHFQDSMYFVEKEMKDNAIWPDLAHCN